MTTDIRTSTVLWIEAGAMSGPPNHRHQIEFPDDVARYFTDEERASEVIRMSINGNRVNRPLTYRGNDYGQYAQMWRLGLPTLAMGGVPYAGQLLRLERKKDGPRFIYEITVAPVDSPIAEMCRAEASKRGNLDTTGGPQGRDFGYW